MNKYITNQIGLTDYFFVFCNWRRPWQQHYVNNSTITLYAKEVVHQLQPLSFSNEPNEIYSITYQTDCKTGYS